MRNAPRALVFMALAMITIGLVSPAQAQTSTSTTDSVIANWTNPGTFPFRGNYSDVCTLYSDEITGEQCARAIDEEERGLGDELFLQDGFILEVSFTVGEEQEHKSKILRVMFGDDVPADDPMRRALVFDTGRSDGLKLVRPDECGNWSLMTIGEPKPTTVEVEVTPTQEEWVLVCEDVYVQRTGPGGDSLLLSGQLTCGGGCDKSFYVPSLLLEGSSLQSRGQQNMCRWLLIQR